MDDHPYPIRGLWVANFDLNLSMDDLLKQPKQPSMELFRSITKKHRHPEYTPCFDEKSFDKKLRGHPKIS